MVVDFLEPTLLRLTTQIATTDIAITELEKREKDVMERIRKIISRSNCFIQQIIQNTIDKYKQEWIDEAGDMIIEPIRVDDTNPNQIYQKCALQITQSVSEKLKNAITHSLKENLEKQLAVDINMELNQLLEKIDFFKSTQHILNLRSSMLNSIYLENAGKYLFLCVGCQLFGLGNMETFYTLLGYLTLGSFWSRLLDPVVIDESWKQKVARIYLEQIKVSDCAKQVKLCFCFIPTDRQICTDLNLQVAKIHVDFNEYVKSLRTISSDKTRIISQKMALKNFYRWSYSICSS